MEIIKIFYIPTKGVYNMKKIPANHPRIFGYKFKTISVVSQKGGVAKSTSCICIAQILCERYRVILIDLDPQNALTSHFVNSYEEIKNRTIRQVLKKEIDIKNSLIPIHENLSLIPAEKKLNIIDKELLDVPNQCYLLYECLLEFKDSYDYLIIDTSPSMNLLNQMAIFSSNFVVIPTQLEKWAIRALSNVIERINICKNTQQYTDKKIEQILILPTFYVKRSILNNYFLEELKKKYDGLVSDFLIHRSTEISKTFSMQNEFISKSSRSYKEYKSFVHELLFERKNENG